MHSHAELTPLIPKKNQFQQCLENVVWERKLMTGIAFASGAGANMVAFVAGIFGLIHFGYPGWKEDKSTPAPCKTQTECDTSKMTDWIIFAFCVVLSVVAVFFALKKTIAFFRAPELTLGQLTQETQYEVRSAALQGNFIADEDTPLSEIVASLSTLSVKPSTFGTFRPVVPLIVFDEPIVCEDNAIIQP